MIRARLIGEDEKIRVAWAGMNTRQYKNLKGLKKENLRDNMSDLELVLTMLRRTQMGNEPKSNYRGILGSWRQTEQYLKGECE